MDPSILEDIGLTNAEIKVYLALLELGSSTAGPIIEKSGLQSSVVYMTFQKLLDKGLVSTIKEGKRTHYQASNPRNIVQYIDDKKERFVELLPELLLKQQLGGTKRDASFFTGVRGVKELLYELLEAGGTEHHTLGSPGVSNVIFPEAWWISYHIKRAAMGIKAKLVFNESLKKYKSSAEYPYSETRYTNFGLDEPLTETIIRNNTVGIIIWTDKPIGILIRNEAAAKSYDRYWKYLWDAAKKS
ncbi:MAG: helix-turn-helix domain-containing protein [Candidatus Woesearchaeota archaeon]